VLLRLAAGLEALLGLSLRPAYAPSSILA